MPTILINTNLSASRNGDNCGSSENGIHEDFKQDLNSIISKLLTKSETVINKSKTKKFFIYKFYLKKYYSGLAGILY